MSANTIYEVAAKLSLVDNMSGALGVIAKELTGVHGSVEKLQKSIAGMSATAQIAKGALLALGGSAVIGSLWKVANYGEKLLDQQDKLQRSGLKLNEVLKVQADFYSRVAKEIPTSTASSYLKMVNELRSVTGDTEKAVALAPWATKLEAILANATGRSAEGEGYKMWRALEMKGITASDPAGASRLADALAQDIIGSGGKLDAGTYQALAKRAGVSWLKASSKFIAGPLSVVAADLGGDTTGTALQTAYQLTSGATAMSKQQMTEFMKLGLLDPSKVHKIPGSSSVSMDPGALKGGALASSNLYEWVQKVLMPAESAHYGGDKQAIEMSIAKIARNRNVMRMLTMFSDPGFVEQIQKDLELWEHAHGVEQSYVDALKRNPSMVKNAFHAQFESMMEAVGSPLMMAALPVLTEMTKFFTWFGNWANQHPGDIERAGKAVAFLGAGMIALGGVFVTSGFAAMAAALGPTGWLVLGLGGLATYLKAFEPEKFETLKNFLIVEIPNGVAKMVTALDTLVAKLLSVVGDIVHFAKNLFGIGPGSTYADSAARMRGMGAGGAAGVGGIPGVSRSGAGGGNLGFSPSGAWWTPERQAYITGRLMKEAGLSPTGAHALVSTWAGIEAPGGPNSHNSIGGGHWGFGQWGLARGGRSVAGMGMEDQTTKAVRELLSTESRAAALLRSHDAATAARGAAAFERGGYGADAVMRAMKRNKTQPSSDQHVHIYLDGEKIHSSVIRRMVANASFAKSAPYSNGQRHFPYGDSGLVNI